MTDFIDKVLEPFIRIAKESSDVKALIGNSVMFRNLFSEWFDKSEMKLEDLPQSEKQELWEQSKVYCPEFRVQWCKAVKFYETF